MGRTKENEAEKNGDGQFLPSGFIGQEDMRQVLFLKKKDLHSMALAMKQRSFLHDQHAAELSNFSKSVILQFPLKEFVKTKKYFEKKQALKGLLKKNS